MLAAASKGPLDGRIYDCGMDLAQWIRSARKHAGLSQEGLGKVIGRTKANVGHWETGKHSPSYEQVMAISEALNYPAPVLKKCDGLIAHPTSHKLGSIEQIVSMLWEELMGLKLKGELPPLFQVAAPDNAMSPRLRQGVKATFERDLVPQFGDGVLVKDNAGELHIRYYRRGRPGTWEAHAESEDYAPLVSDRDGLEIWAVLTAVEGRWS
jgi:transcriptional regulator with XRE-family HTH domain